MAKKKQSQALVTRSTAKKPSEVASTSKKPSEMPSPVKKPSGVTSPAKKPLDVASPAKKPLEESSTTAKKKQPEPVKNLMPESSSEEEEEDSSADEEEEPSKDSGKKNPETAVVTNQSSVSESEPETKSESDTETEPTAKTPTPATAPASLNKKRQSEGEPSTEEVNVSKRAKTESERETAKKQLFQRLWSEEDEIVFLQGMIDFRRDIDHDKKCFELAKMIWGSDVDATLVKSKRKIKVDDSLKVDGVKVECDWFVSSFLIGSFKNLGAWIDEETLKVKWSLVPVKTRKRIEEKIKSVQANEFKLMLQKLEVLHEVSSLMAKSD
ncbi:hypothetical protein ARALYDRAFT_916208 [Arabidopsis lyrata subsp. lyrata]|uniref:Glabrous enhancer-binding protein-like C-terminal domain-containing protein n=1 Tax=Arabidopsis lyrata subsp. lyrata TaxID=81972 RepID=D7MJ89_ARALL|nr:hypothetical protein ARALYDRAFT_916208 [Arabidopsis lyrata subsp. lyrata]